MKPIKCKIKDVEWSFRILSDSDYEKEHGKESHGVTEKYKLKVDFKLTSFSQRLVTHELFHVYVSSCCVNSIPEIDDLAMEEIGAEIVEFHCEDILKTSKKLYNSLSIQAKKIKEDLQEDIEDE